MRRLELPIRVLGLSNQGIPLFNFLASIDKFTWGMDRSDNIHYEIKLTEFRETFVNFLNRRNNPNETIESYIRGIDIRELLRTRGLIQ